MEVMPAPFGVVSSLSKTSSSSAVSKNMRDSQNEVSATNTAEIVLAGTLSLTSSTAPQLAPGMNYYANTMGEVLSGGTFYGRGGSSAYSSAYYYVESADGSTIVTLDSKVGVATAANAIYVQPK